jgi:hypothetical protein
MRINLMLLTLLAAAPTAAFAQLPGPTPGIGATTPETGAVLTVLERVCLPLSRGAHLDGVARTNGLQQRNGQWVLPIRGPEQIVVTPPDTANPTLCRATITYAIDQDQPILQEINNWAADHTPPLKARKIEVAEPGPAMLRKVSTWEVTSASETDAVVLAREQTLQGQPVDGQYDKAVLLVSVTPASPS